MSGETYNGWRNRDTWAIALWLNNDEGFYATVGRDCADIMADLFDEDEPSAFDADEAIYQLADRIEALIVDTIDMAESAMTTPGEYVTETTLSMVRDIGLQPIDVDWHAIASPWIYEAWNEVYPKGSADE